MTGLGQRLISEESPPVHGKPIVRLLARLALVAQLGVAAHADVHIGIGLGFVPPPVYYGPPPQYYSPPPPVYYGPGVIYGEGGWNYGGDDDDDGWRGRGWAHDRWHGDRGWGRWGDRDGHWHGGR